MANPKLFEVVSVAESAGRLSEPFTMIDLATLDDLVLSLYLCQGAMPQHRHLDQDELFLVYSGTISLESDWGTAILRPGELAVAPKGVGHRSSSLLRSVVLLLQPRLVINRRNGDRRLFALQNQGRVEKVNATAVGSQISVSHTPVLLADVDTCALNMVLCTGVGPWRTAELYDSLVYCFVGRVNLESEGETVSLQRGELTKVPKGMTYRLSSDDDALVLELLRHRQPNQPLKE